CRSGDCRRVSVFDRSSNATTMTRSYSCTEPRFLRDLRAFVAMRPSRPLRLMQKTCRTNATTMTRSYSRTEPKFLRDLRDFVVLALRTELPSINREAVDEARAAGRDQVFLTAAAARMRRVPGA